MTAKYPLTVMTTNPGVYALVCRSTGKIYIGQSVNLNRRYQEWKGALTGGFRVSNKNIAKNLLDCPDWDMVILVELPHATPADLDRNENRAIQQVKKKSPELLMNDISVQVPTYMLGKDDIAKARILIKHGDGYVGRRTAAKLLHMNEDTIKVKLQRLKRLGYSEIELEKLGKTKRVLDTDLKP